MRFRGLEWHYSAETISIMVTTFVVCINGLRRTVNMWQVGTSPVAAPQPVSCA